MDLREDEKHVKAEGWDCTYKGPPSDASIKEIMATTTGTFSEVQTHISKERQLKVHVIWNHGREKAISKNLIHLLNGSGEVIAKIERRPGVAMLFLDLIMQKSKVACEKHHLPFFDQNLQIKDNRLCHISASIGGIFK